jgi:hypothetical protein
VGRLRLFEAKADGRTGTALGTIGCAARRTEHRHQVFICIATDIAVGLNRSDGSAGRSGIALCARSTLRSLRTLGALRPLSALLSLRAGYALQALRALRPGWSLWAGIPFRSRIASAPRKGQRRAHDDSHQNPSHSASPPDFLVACIKWAYSLVCNGKSGGIESAVRSYVPPAARICASCERHRRHIAVQLELSSVRSQDVASN